MEMGENIVKIDEQGFKIEIGENLLKAIKSVVNATEKVNTWNNLKLLHPGEEVKKALGMDLTKVYKQYIKVLEARSKQIRKQHTDIITKEEDL